MISLWILLFSFIENRKNSGSLDLGWETLDISGKILDQRFLGRIFLGRDFERHIK